MPVTIHTEKELYDLAAESVRVLHNLRFWTKYWQEHLGSHAKRKKEYWEQKADALLNELGMTEHNNTRTIKYSITNDERFF